MTDLRKWVMDTCAYTHLCRAGHENIIEKLAPSGVVLVPDEVNSEIERGRDRYLGIPAVAQARRFQVSTHDTLWVVIEAYKELYGRDRDLTARVVDDLLATGMYLPVSSGESVLSWAYENGLLP